MYARHSSTNPGEDNDKIFSISSGNSTEKTIVLLAVARNGGYHEKAGKLL